MARRDFQFPLRVVPQPELAAELHVNRQVAAAATYPEHIAQMVRQLLLTSPGERACLPEFGCGLRRLLFAPLSEGLSATVQVEVRQALDRWLGTVIAVQDVTVISNGTGGVLEASALLVTVSYIVVDTLTTHTTEVLL